MRTTILKRGARHTWARLALKTFVTLTITSTIWIKGVEAQTTQGTILGRVSDTTGAVISGSEVKLVNESTGTKLTTKTNGSGNYIFNGIPPGEYEVIISHPEFQNFIIRNIVLDSNGDISENAILSPGSASSEIEVTALAPLINTQSPTLGSVIDSKQIQQAPLNGRSNSYSLMALAAGVQRPNSNALIAGSSFTGGTTATVDGIVQNDIFNARMSDPIPSLDDISEFRVIDSIPPAEFGRGGAQVIYVTKSGTNKLHGDLFAFNRNRFFAARGFFTLKARLSHPLTEMNLVEQLVDQS